MTTIDLSPIITPILQVIGLVIAGVIAAYVPKAIAAFMARTGVQMTAQQQATVLGAAQTAAGRIETLLDQRALAVAEVKTDNPTVVQLAQEAVAAVPLAAAALGVTPEGIARIIVGKVDTLARVAPAPAPAAQPQGAST
jgi:hypothetical protein